MKYVCENCGTRCHDENGDYEGTTCKVCGCGTLVRAPEEDVEQNQEAE